MRPIAGSLFADLPLRSAREQSIDLLALRGLRIERIVSTGQTSPPGFWYEQAWSEWLVLISGAARIEFAGEPEALGLEAGDHLLIPARCRHRVAWTDEARPTIWLAVHFGDPPRTEGGSIPLS